MRLCNYRLMNAIVFLIKMLVECKYSSIQGFYDLKGPTKTTTPHIKEDKTDLHEFTEEFINKHCNVLQNCGKITGKTNTTHCFKM